MLVRLRVTYLVFSMDPIVPLTRLYRISVRSLVMRACGDEVYNGCFSTSG